MVGPQGPRRLFASLAVFLKVHGFIDDFDFAGIAFFILAFFSAMAGRFRQARCGLYRQHLRLRDLGRFGDLVYLLQGHHAAARRLNNFQK
jgi:hypothetical protein